MSISWTKKWDATDDGSVVRGSELGTLQDDIDAGTAGSLPTPGVSDALKLPRVKSDHSTYELISEVPMAAGGTGADLSTGTAGYAVVSQGTAGNMTLAPLYHTQTVTFLATSAAQTIYCTSPVAGNVSAVYANQHVAARAATYTITVGSAGATLASGTTTTAGVAGAVTALTVTTTNAVAAGGSIGVARGVQGTDGAATITIVIIKTP